jgi:hypothetical protein
MQALFRLREQERQIVRCPLANRKPADGELKDAEAKISSISNHVC